MKYLHHIRLYIARLISRDKAVATPEQVPYSSILMDDADVVLTVTRMGGPVNIRCHRLRATRLEDIPPVAEQDAQENA